MMKGGIPIITICVLFIVSSCDNFSIKNNKRLLAKVGEAELYLEDIPKDKLSLNLEGDSATKLRYYIEKWSKEQFFLQNAKETIGDDESQLNDIIEEYRRNLMIYELERKWLDNYSDTVVSDSAIKIYYENNKDNFQLRKNIVKIRYIKISRTLSTKEINKVRILVKNTTPTNDSLLRIFAETKADNFFLDNTWLYFDDVLREIPISSNYNQERFLQNNRYVELEEGGYIYLVNFIDFKTKDNITPLEFESDNIKKYIIMQRKAQYIEDKRKGMLEDAYKSGKIKIWLN
ncbi:MAG: hypothetical protein J5I91_03875 [Bacteroidetes bacterium]|nr:hypothetical protein [Bacteroidota bacterium]